MRSLPRFHLAAHPAAVALGSGGMDGRHAVPDPPPARATVPRQQRGKQPRHVAPAGEPTGPGAPGGSVLQHGDLAVLVIAVAACALLAWNMRFVCDDAYISWRYSRHLAEGRGLVWNPGARVEGYTNFVWTVLSGVPLALGLNIEQAMEVVGVALFTASLVLFRCVALGLGVGRWTSLMATVALGTLTTFASFATGGLETQLQALLCLVVAALALSSRPLEPLRSVGLGVATALALGTRLDSVLLIAPLLAALAIRLHRSEGRRGLLRMTPALSVCAVLVGAWFVWKLFYYGSVLPNTLRAKVAGESDRLRHGLRYLWAFARSYLFVLPLLFLPAGVLRSLRGPIRAPAGIVAAAMLVGVALWVSYVAWVGGDFIEFRMLVPALPLTLALAFAGARAPVAAALLAANLFYGSVRHAHGYHDHMTAYGGPESITSLSWHVSDEGSSWAEVGRRLHEAFPDQVRPSIAVTAAGAIPFYSRLPAVDMLGLNDEDVDKFLVVSRMATGHQRLIPLSLLRRRGVTFLIGHPAIADRRGLSPEDRFTYQEFTSARLFLFPDEASLRGLDLIEMPLSRERVLLMVYLTPSSAVSARLSALGWRRYPLM
jgi:arabinofuranosyltransferase